MNRDSTSLGTFCATGAQGTDRTLLLGELNNFPLAKGNTYLIGAANLLALPVENKSCFIEAIAISVIWLTFNSTGGICRNYVPLHEEEKQ